MRALSVDLADPDGRPYFLWDEDVSVAELRAALQPGRDGANGCACSASCCVTSHY